MARNIVQKIRITRQERAEWRAAAKARRITISQLVRDAVLSYAQKLTPAQYAPFVTSIDTMLGQVYAQRDRGR